MLVTLASVLIDFGINAGVLKTLIFIKESHMESIFNGTIAISLLGMTIITGVLALNREEYLKISTLRFMTEKIKLKRLFLYQFISILGSYLCLIFAGATSITIIAFASLFLILWTAYQIYEYHLYQDSLKEEIRDYYRDTLLICDRRMYKELLDNLIKSYNSLVGEREFLEASTVFDLLIDQYLFENGHLSNIELDGEGNQNSDRDKENSSEDDKSNNNGEIKSITDTLEWQIGQMFNNNFARYDSDITFF